MPHKNTSKREPPPKPRNISGRYIKEVRQSIKPKVSQDDLAGRLAAKGLTLTRTQIAKIESGRRPVLDYELRAIAKSLKVQPQRLLGG